MGDPTRPSVLAPCAVGDSTRPLPLTGCLCWTLDGSPYSIIHSCALRSGRPCSTTSFYGTPLLDIIRTRDGRPYSTIHSSALRSGRPCSTTSDASSGHHQHSSPKLSKLGLSCCRRSLPLNQRSVAHHGIPGAHAQTHRESRRGHYPPKLDPTKAYG